LAVSTRIFTLSPAFRSEGTCALSESVYVSVAPVFVTLTTRAFLSSWSDWTVPRTVMWFEPVAVALPVGAGPTGGGTYEEPLAEAALPPPLPAPVFAAPAGATMSSALRPVWTQPSLSVFIPAPGRTVPSLFGSPGSDGTTTCCSAPAGVGGGDC